MTDRTTTHDPTGGRASDYAGSHSPGSRPGEGEFFDDSDRERARQAAEEIKTAAKDAAANTATALRNRLSGELDYRKYRSRQRLNRMADALRQAGVNVNTEDDMVGRSMERAAQGVERVAAYLDARDVNQIMRDARDAARRRPEVFVGSMFVAGLVLGRFLRSSSEESHGSSWDSGSYRGGSDPYPQSGRAYPQPPNPYAGASTPYAGSGSNPASSTPGGRMP